MYLHNVFDRRPRVRHGFPIAPGAFPLIGHMPTMATDPLAFLRATEKRVGPFFWVDGSGIGKGQLTCTLSDAFATVFRNRTTTSNYLRELLPMLFGESMIVHDGPPHQHARGAMNAPFTPRGLSAAEVGTTFAGLVEHRVERWITQGSIALLDQCREAVLELMFSMLGVANAELAAWRKAYESLMLLGLGLPGPLRTRGLKARAWLDAEVLTLVRNARTRTSGGGLLDALVHARDEGGAALTDAELVDNVRLLLLAGHETSASTIAWAIARLAERRDVWQRVREEATSAPGIPTDARALKGLPYAEAVFRETLRLHPPVTADSRRATTDFELCGRTVPANTILSIPLLLLSRDPAIYDRPDDFVAERWLDRTAPPSPLELAQFGGGPHFCLGYHVAWLEIVQFIVAFARGLDARGLRPELEGAPPKPRYLPLAHPDGRARVRFVRA